MKTAIFSGLKTFYEKEMFHLLFSSGYSTEHKDSQRPAIVSWLEMASPHPKFPLPKSEAFPAPNMGLGSATTLQTAQSCSRTVEPPNLRDALPESRDKTVTATSRLSVRFRPCPCFLISSPHDFHPIPGMFPQVYFPYLNPRSSLTDNL